MNVRVHVAAAILLVVSGSAGFSSEREMVAKFCAGMEQEYRLPDRTRIDCLSGTHAIEVDFSSKWAEAIGQALHYSLWTAELPSIGPKAPGIILVCTSKKRDTCLDHIRRIRRVVQAYDLPMTLWDCDEADEFLSDCVEQPL